MGDVDRLKELKLAAGADDKPTEEDEKTKDKEKNLNSKQKAEIADHMKLYDIVKESLQVIKTNVGKIEKLREKDRKTANEKERKEIMSTLDKTMEETNQNGARIKKQLEFIKNENDKYAKEHKDSAKHQMRTNLYQTHVRRFHQIMNDYNLVSNDFRQALQDRTRRQLKIVDKDITDDEVEKIVESGKAQEVIKQALMSDDLDDVVRDIEERHQDILKLERQVLEVYELFRDLAQLVDLQQDSLDVIDARIQSAKNYTERAEGELIEAEDYQKKARKRQCIILGIVIAVLVVILAPTLSTVLKSS